jgi:hypothetical protein
MWRGSASVPCRTGVALALLSRHGNHAQIRWPAGEELAILVSSVAHIAVVGVPCTGAADANAAALALCTGSQEQDTEPQDGLFKEGLAARPAR